MWQLVLTAFRRRQLVSGYRFVSTQGLNALAAQVMELCDLLQSVPHLSNTISRRGHLGLLQSVSRQLRSWVHSYCTQLRLNALIPDEYWLGPIPEEHYRILAAWFWPNLQSLSIQVDPFDADLIRFLSQGQWPVLQQLYIQFSTFESDCLRLISKAAPNLCQLTLKGCHLAWCSADVTQLMQGEWSQLQRLRLTQHRLTGVVQQLSTWPRRQHITELDLSGNGLKATDVQALRLHEWPLLKRLCLSNNDLGCQGLQELCKFAFTCLEEIDLSHSRLDYEQSQITVPHIIWPALRVLNMFAAGVDLKVMSQLVNVNCPHLTVYDLTSAHCTKNMVRCLVSCPYQALTALNLSWGCLDLAGVQELVKGNWPRLVKLDVHGNDLCSGAVSHLIQCGSWPQLVGLDMSRNPMSVFSTIKVGNGQSLSLVSLVRSAGTMPAWLQQKRPAIEWIDLSDCQRVEL